MANVFLSRNHLRRIVPVLGGLCLLTLVLLGIAYQVRLSQTLSISKSDWLYANGYLKGLYPRQGDDENPYRFTDGNAAITLPSPGQFAALQIGLRMNAWRPDRAGEMDISINGVPMRHFVNFELKTHRVVITDTRQLQPNTLVIGIDSDTFKPQDYDPNNPDPSTLGIILESITLTPLDSTAQWVVPSWDLIFVVGALASVVYLAGMWLELPRLGFGLALAVIGVFALLVALSRYTAATYLVTVALAAVIVLFLANRARPHPKPISRQMVWSFILVILLLAFYARLMLVTQLPDSVDELTYVPVSARYAQMLERGDWNGVLRYRGNAEHPLFNKLAFAAGILVGHAVGITDDALSARWVSITASILQTALVALLNPFAAAFLAIHTVHIQFTSLAYLEALPSLTSTLTVVAFDRTRRHGKKWLYISALALGLTAASKYLYAAVGLAVLPFLLWRYRRQPWHIVGYGLLVALCFFAANPILWSDPVATLRETVTYHLDYSASAGVTRIGRPPWWHLVYLARVQEWQTLAALPPDTWVFVLGLLGLPNMWRRHRIYFAWFAVTLIFLLVWNTKWEQYAIALIPPLCLSAGWGITALATELEKRANTLVLRLRRNSFRQPF